MKVKRSGRSTRNGHGEFRQARSATRRHTDFAERRHVSKLRERSITRALSEDGFQEGPSKEADAIIQKVDALSEDQLNERYHQLVDQRFECPLDYTERFELERIEARFDAASENDLNRVAAERRAWEADRAELITSLERVLADLQVPR